MPSRKTHDAVVTLGEYTERSSGQIKKRYKNVGAVFTDETGRIALKLDTLPVGPEWSGWVAFYPVDRNNSQRPATGNPSTEAEARAMHQPPPAGGDDFEDDIPF